MSTTRQNGGGAATATPALTSAQTAKMKSLGIEFSEEAEERHLKVMFWGATSTRKTEGVLRNFPNVLLIDAEGNSDQCVKNRNIPPFQRVKTQDSRKVLEVLEAAAEGLIRMPNGQPIQTVCIDSISVIWSVQQEVAAALAEQRASRYNKAASEATVTMQDWGKAKRPLKMVLNRFSKTTIPYLILIAREKDLYQELPNGDLKKVGVTYNAVKDTEYDMNLVLHFLMDENRKWAYEVSKVQGGLNDIFPIGGRGNALPMDKLFEYAARLKPEAQEATGDDEDLADKIASSMMAQVDHTQSNLIKYATEKGFSAQELGNILKDAGFSSFDATHWDAMVKAIYRAAETSGKRW